MTPGGSAAADADAPTAATRAGGTVGLGDDPVAREAIERWHEGLTDDVAEATSAALTARLRRDNLYFGDRPLCSVLRPRLMTLAQYRTVRRAASRVARALDRVRAAAMVDDALRERFKLYDWEERAIHADPGYPVASPLSRLDMFFAAGSDGLKVTEYNAETPAGQAYNDALSEAFVDTPAGIAFRRRAALLPLPSLPGTIGSLLEAWRVFRRTREVPQVAILDWNEVPTQSEFTLVADRLQAMGIPTFIGDPRDAEYANGRLTVAGKPVTLVYKRVLLEELVRRGGEDHPLLRAVRDRAVCMVNPLRCRLLNKKAGLGVVGDERHADLLDAEQRAAVAAHVPWTRLVEERRTIWRGEQIDLLPFVAGHREHFVLKPNDDYGGRGIVLGWLTDAETWQRALRDAVATPTIVQERIVLPSEPWPSWDDGRLHVDDRLVDTAPFIVDGAVVDGCLTRIATDPLLNVTSGGGSNVPTFLVELRG